MATRNRGGIEPPPHSSKKRRPPYRHNVWIPPGPCGDDDFTPDRIKEWVSASTDDEAERRDLRATINELRVAGRMANEVGAASEIAERDLRTDGEAREQRAKRKRYFDGLAMALAALDDAYGSDENAKLWARRTVAELLARPGRSPDALARRDAVTGEPMASDPEEWRMASASAARRAVLSEKDLEVRTVLAFEERGGKRFAAVRFLTGLPSDEARDSALDTALDRTLTAIAKREDAMLAPAVDLDDEERAEWNRVLSTNGRQPDQRREAARSRQAKAAKEAVRRHGSLLAATYPIAAQCCCGRWTALRLEGYAEGPSERIRGPDAHR